MSTGLSADDQRHALARPRFISERFLHNDLHLPVFRAVFWPPSHPLP